MWSNGIFLFIQQPPQCVEFVFRCVQLRGCYCIQPPNPPPQAPLFILIINNALLCSLLHLSPVVSSMLLNKLWTPPVQLAASPLICPSPTLSLSLWWVCLFVHLFVCLSAFSNFTAPAHTWLNCCRLTEIQLILWVAKFNFQVSYLFSSPCGFFPLPPQIPVQLSCIINHLNKMSTSLPKTHYKYLALCLQSPTESETGDQFFLIYPHVLIEKQYYGIQFSRKNSVQIQENMLSFS